MSQVPRRKDVEFYMASNSRVRSAVEALYLEDQMILVNHVSLALYENRGWSRLPIIQQGRVLFSAYLYIASLKLLF
jgi:hypothetical protein